MGCSSNNLKTRIIEDKRIYLEKNYLIVYYNRYYINKATQKKKGERIKIIYRTVLLD
jgi:hypothetical protein